MNTPKLSVAAGGLMLASLVQLGCARPAQFAAIRSDADQGRLVGLSEESVFGWGVGVPARHDGEFSRVEQVNAWVERGPGKGGDLSIVLGKRRETGRWEVLRATRNDGGGWYPITAEQVERIAATLEK